MLCDQASDTINSRSLPTAVHQPLATFHLFFYNRIDQLSIPRAEINPGHYSG